MASSMDDIQAFYDAFFPRAEAAIAYCDKFPLDDMLAIGDSDVDLSMMALTGRAASPANAQDEVKDRSDYVSPYPTSRGVLDILQRSDGDGR